MIQLKNNTRTASKIGYVVSIDPRDPLSFVYTVPNSVKAIGVVTEIVAYRASCKIATMGDKARVYVSANVNKDDIIRLGKPTDKVSLGACTVAKPGSTPYLKIGDALNSGKGLIAMVLDLQYTASSTIIGGITTPISFPYTVTPSDTFIICDSAVAVTVNLPRATGSSRELKIASIGVGEVTVEAYSTDEIDDELNQPINQWETIVIIDYITANWKII